MTTLRTTTTVVEVLVQPDNPALRVTTTAVEVAVGITKLHAHGTSDATGNLTIDAPLLYVGSSGGAIATGGGSRSVTLTQAIQRDFTILVGWHFTNSGATSPYASAACTDSKGNTYTTDLLENTNTDRSLKVFRTVVTNALVAGDTITVTHGSGYNSGARSQMLAVRYNLILTPVVQSTVDTAFAASIDSTFTYTGPDNIFIAMAGGGFDSNDIIGAGDAAWKGHIDFSDGTSGIWFAYQPDPTANDSWNAPLQQTRDFYGSGYTYDGEEGGLKGTSAGTSTATATMARTVGLLGTSAATSTGLGRLNHKALEGLSFYGDSYSDEEEVTTEEPWAFGILSVLTLLQGSTAGSSTLVGILGPTHRDLHGTSAGVTTTVGRLTGELALVGLAAGSATTSARITGQWALKGLAACGSYAQGHLMALNDTDWGEFPPPNVPPERVVFIRYRGHDITRRVLYQGTRFRTSARGTPGECVIRIRDDRQQFDFITGGSITLDVGTTRHWGGYLATVKRGYFFEGSHDSPGEIVRYIELRGLDYNVLFHKRFLYDKVSPTSPQLTSFPADTPDDEVLTYYSAHHLDLHGDGLDTSTYIEHVGTPSQDDEIGGNAGWSWWQFLVHMRFHTGAIDYIDPDKNVIHTDVDTPNAPFGISDDPDGTEVGCRELEIDFDAAKMRNDALIWGAGQGSTNVVFSRTTDAPTIATHGLWQVGQFLPTVWRQATVDRIADSWVYGSPQNKRGGKDDRVAVQCTVFEPVFRVAQKVEFRSAVWNVSDVIPIRDIEIDFPTPWHPRFKLTLSHEIDDPFSTYETWFPDFGLPDFNLPTLSLPPPPTTIFEPGGGPFIGEIHQNCNDGQVVYENGYTGQDLLDSGVLEIRLRYAKGNWPNTLPTYPGGHPSGNDAYMIDGSPATGREGYRLSTKDDSVIWQSYVPLIISGVELYQGMAAYSTQPSRHRSVWIHVYAGTKRNGDDATLIATWGEHLPSRRGIDPSRRDPSAGVEKVSITFGFDPTESSGGLSYGNVRYVSVHSSQGYWFKTSGLYEFGGRWRISSARLSAVCDFTNWYPSQDGNAEGGNGAAYVGPSDTPEGEDPEAVYFYTATPWLEGTLRVYLDGLLLQPGIDYEFNVEDHWIKFPAGFEGDPYVRYYPR